MTSALQPWPLDILEERKEGTAVSTIGPVRWAGVKPRAERLPKRLPKVYPLPSAPPVALLGGEQWGKTFAACKSGAFIVGRPNGYLSPDLTPWGTEKVPIEGQLILPGATGANANVGASAAQASFASGIAVADVAVEQIVCSYTVPWDLVGVVTGFYAAPDSSLGDAAGNVVFNLDINGWRTRVPPRRRGLLGSFTSLIPCQYVVAPTRTFTILASNGSTATWFSVSAAFEILLIRRDAFRRFIDCNIT